jgi:hypothetical protein
VSKKRYHYDSKGRFKGHSSSESPQSRNAKAALLVVIALIVYGLFFKSKDDDNPTYNTKASDSNVIESPKTGEHGKSEPSARID